MENQTTLTPDRSIHELLILVKDEVLANRNFTDSNRMSFYGGLCPLISNLVIYTSITKNEYTRLMDYLYDNRPKVAEDMPECVMLKTPFWEAHKIQPRLNWLYYHIRKTKNQIL